MSAAAPATIAPTSQSSISTLTHNLIRILLENRRTLPFLRSIKSYIYAVDNYFFCIYIYMRVSVYVLLCACSGLTLSMSSSTHKRTHNTTTKFRFIAVAFAVAVATAFSFDGFFSMFLSASSAFFLLDICFLFI